MLRELRQTIVVFSLLTIVTGVLYPGVTTVIGQLAFTHAVRGSIIEVEGRAVGSRLLGQPSSRADLFWSRPSATGPVPYNGAVSSGSNQGPINPSLAAAVEARIAALRSADPTNTRPVPVDLVTASGSGLDPHISIAAAEYQMARVARARAVPEAEVLALVRQHTEGRTFHVLGEPRVNVLELNLALEGLETRE